MGIPEQNDGSGINRSDDAFGVHCCDGLTDMAQIACT